MLVNLTRSPSNSTRVWGDFVSACAPRGSAASRRPAKRLRDGDELAADVCSFSVFEAVGCGGVFCGFIEWSSGAVDMPSYGAN